MQWESGLYLTTAAKFQVEPRWEERLTLLEPDQQHETIRPASAAEIESLTNCAASSSPNIEFFALPQHLHDSWWKILDPQELQTGHLSGFESFSERAHSFLKFKGLPIPPAPKFELLVTHPEEMGESKAQVNTPSCWGLINLNDQPTAIRHEHVQFMVYPFEGCRLSLDIPLFFVSTVESDLSILMRIKS